MCGICGKVYTDAHERVEEIVIRKMCGTLLHRGPDESGFHVERQVGLGHRRLSIIDLSTGQQPMCNARRDLWIVYNGELYNFPALRKELAHLGYRFLTHSDTEVILHLYDEYGTSCVNFMRGMFAFAIWDERRQRLFLARDRVGQKPLFYTTAQNAILFASEIKAILQDTSVQRELNVTAMSHYLTYGYVPPPDTMFQHIYKLPPAHTLVYQNGIVKEDRYWDVRYEPKVRMSRQEVKSSLKDLLQEAVRIRMTSDVPLGAFLSGGIDSSLVVAIMSHESRHPVQTFSIGFKEKRFNELPYARMIAERFQTDHHEFIMEPNAVEILPKLVWHFDEPFGDSSAIPTYYLSQMTSGFVKVALNGDGGDESFAGYLRYMGYRLVRLYRMVPHAIRKKLLAPLIHLAYAGVNREQVPPWCRAIFRRTQLLSDLSLEPERYHYVKNLIIFFDELKTELLTRDVKKQLRTRHSLDDTFRYFDAENARHSTDKMLYADVMTYLPGDLLVKMDRMTMAHGLEGRSPFLDHPLMEFAATIPARYKMHGASLKWILKDIARSWLPESILTREKKGFSIPLSDWFRHELRDMVHDIFSSSYLLKEGILRQTPLQNIIAEHQSGKLDHRHKIWLFLNLELWYRMFIRNE
ncbi:asparagine synthase (glutamine-hydrolyzing) [candidate division KSB3 bacterium]|uniref:asparagine synthase (glutamine-hydrolyzing) n=1 Tax=candidate division KSB3 bacterium TaxID=2044937 RepID=A0A2G6KI12_9BACT|nr:MAG: asparagine synthase (glutamine-hydrolyzing) [candidate division KSB3 bacterium]